MQQLMDLFGKELPDWLKGASKHRHGYGLNVYYVGQIMAGQAGSKSDVEDDPSSNSDPNPNLKEAKQAFGLVAMVYHGIHNLDVSPQVQVPHEMLLALNPSQIFQLYAGTWLLKMDAAKWDNAVNKHNFWQVVSSARTEVSENPMSRHLLRRLDDLCGRTYLADEDGNMPARLRQLPQYVADQFMQAFTNPFRSPNEKAGYVPASKLKVTLDQTVFGHFAQKFAEGERQLSLAKT